MRAVAYVAGLTAMMLGTTRFDAAVALVGALLIIAVLSGPAVFNLAHRVIGLVAELVRPVGDKLAGKVNPEFAAAIRSLNNAHENDKRLDNRMTQIESKLGALSVAVGMKNQRVSGAVRDMVG